MKFLVTYLAWRRVITEKIEANSEEAARREVNRTLFAPDGKVLTVFGVAQEEHDDDLRDS